MEKEKRIEDEWKEIEKLENDRKEKINMKFGFDIEELEKFKVLEKQDKIYIKVNVVLKIIFIVGQVALYLALTLGLVYALVSMKS